MCEYDYSLPSVVLIYYYIVLKIELMIYFPCSAIYVPYSGRRNRAGELHKGVDTDKRLPFFKRKYIVGDTATPMRQALLLAAL